MAIKLKNVWNSPQADDDAYWWAEDELWDLDYFYEGVITLDVMANDAGGNGKSLYSIDDGDGNFLQEMMDNNVTTGWEETVGGNRIQIIDGKIEFDIGNDLEEIGGTLDGLAADEVLYDTFTYSIQLGNGTLSWATVTIQIDGVNDDPEVAAALSATAAEDDLSFTVDMLDGASDADNGETATLMVQNVTGLVPGVTLEGTDLKVDPSDSAFQSLAVGDSQEITVNYEVVDAQGAFVAQTATITINGVNDDPEVAAALSATAAEDDLSFTVDMLDGASDADNGEMATLMVQNVTGLVPGVTLEGTDLKVDPSDSAFQSLAVGDSQEITVNYEVVDVQGASVAQTATITITGTNDAPVAEDDNIGAAFKFSTNELSDPAITNYQSPHYFGDYGVANVFDDDVSGDFNGNSNVYATGFFESEAADAFIEFDFGAPTDIGGFVFYQRGNNNDSVYSFDLIFDDDSDFSSPTTTLTFATAGTPDFSLQGDNVVSGTPDRQEFDFGASVNAQYVKWQVTSSQGIFDGAAEMEFWGASSILTDEDTPATIAARALLANDSDADNGSELTVAGVSATSALGASITLTGADIYYDPSGALDYLAEGETVSDTFTYTIVDEHGASDTATVTVAVTGVNDTTAPPPIIHDLHEGDDGTFTGVAGITDIFVFDMSVEGGHGGSGDNADHYLADVQAGNNTNWVDEEITILNFDINEDYIVFTNVDPNAQGPAYPVTEFNDSFLVDQTYLANLGTTYDRHSQANWDGGNTEYFRQLITTTETNGEDLNPLLHDEDGMIFVEQALFENGPDLPAEYSVRDDIDIYVDPAGTIDAAGLTDINTTAYVTTTVLAQTAAVLYYEGDIVI